MEKKKIHYCFILSEEQMKFLRSKKYKIDRMECFMSLIALAECEPKLVQVSKTQQVEILRGQLMVDNTQLAKLWNKDRKTVPKILEAMESLGISSSQKVGENRVHTLHSLSGWYVDGTLITNPFGIRRSSDGSGIFHTEVPPVRVISIESDETSKDAKTRSRKRRLLTENLPLIVSKVRLRLSLIPCPICHHNLMIVQTRANLAMMLILPFALQLLLPHVQKATSIMLSALLRQKEPMAIRMKGREKRMRMYRSSREVNLHRLTAILRVITSPTAVIFPMATTLNLENIGKRPALSNHPRGRLIGNRSIGSKAGLAVSRATCRLKGPIIYRDFSRNPFVLQSA